MSTFRTLAIVVPTRNRARLAMNAIRSVLAESMTTVRIIVAENSTEPEEVRQLAEFGTSHRAENLHIFRPASPLSMSENWNFGLERALSFPDVSHVVVLTDRMLFKPGELPVLMHATTEHPGHVILFTEDRVYDDRDPIGVVQTRWTGRLVEVSTTHLLQLASQMQLHPAPRLMNCVVPRGVLEAVRTRFGAFTGSVSPDYAFAYRCLYVVDSLLYFDRAPVLYYAWTRSNGAAFMRGVMTRDSRDFLASNPAGAKLVGHAPLPELVTVTNGIINEYCLVQADTGSTKFPSLNWNRYLLANELEIRKEMRDPQRRKELLQIIASQGPFSRKPTLFSLVKRVLAVKDIALLRPFWRFLSFRLRLSPPGDSPVPMNDVREAIESIFQRPRRRHLSGLHLRVLLGKTRTVGFYPSRQPGRPLPREIRPEAS